MKTSEKILWFVLLFALGLSWISQVILQGSMKYGNIRIDVIGCLILFIIYTGFIASILGAGAFLKNHSQAFRNTNAIIIAITSVILFGTLSRKVPEGKVIEKDGYLFLEKEKILWLPILDGLPKPFTTTRVVFVKLPTNYLKDAENATVALTVVSEIRPFAMRYQRNASYWHTEFSLVPKDVETYAEILRGDGVTSGELFEKLSEEHALKGNHPISWKVTKMTLTTAP